MVVIIEYDMADNGRVNPDRRTKKGERKTRHTVISQKENLQATMKPTAVISVTSSISCQGVTWNRNDSGPALLRVYYCGPYKMKSSM
jgi:hypothetical protein